MTTNMLEQVRAEMVRGRITVGQLRPLQGRLVIRRTLRPERTAGGVILPDQSRVISQTGTVVRAAVSSLRACPYCRHALPVHEDLQEGAVVIFSQYSASPCVGTEETDVVFVRDIDILAVVEP